MSLRSSILAKPVLYLPCHFISVALATMLLLGIGKFTMFFVEPAILSSTKVILYTSVHTGYNLNFTYKKKKLTKTELLEAIKDEDIRENYVQ